MKNSQLNTESGKRHSRVHGLLQYGLALAMLMLIAFSAINSINAAPAGPAITFITNSTAVSTIPTRIDHKGTITTLSLSLNQQDYKWKAYIGNVSGSLALDDANGKSIYDWALTNITGEVYATRASTVNWPNVSCITQGIIDSEQSALGMSSTIADSINTTFRYVAHDNFRVGTTNITNSSCRSTATYINDAAQTVNESARFQEVLLRDEVTSSLLYATIIEENIVGYNGSNTYDFQMLVAENESSSGLLTYYFYAELGY